MENEFSFMKEARRENKGGFDKINIKIVALEASIRIIDNVLFGKNIYKQKHENYGRMCVCVE